MKDSEEDLLEQLSQQEDQLQLVYFNHDTAWLLGEYLKNRAQRERAAIAIEIFAFGQVLFSYAMPGTNPDHQQWVLRKRQAVLRFSKSSFFLGEYNRDKRRVLEELSHLDASQYASHGGAFPLRIRNCGVVGVVAVSGLAQRDDHNLVVDGLSYIQGLCAKQPPQIID